MEEDFDDFEDEEEDEDMDDESEEMGEVTAPPAYSSLSAGLALHRNVAKMRREDGKRRSQTGV